MHLEPKKVKTAARRLELRQSTVWQSSLNINTCDCQAHFNSNQLISASEVSLHVPLTDETKDSINKALLSKMPKGGTLINTARTEAPKKLCLSDCSSLGGARS